MRATMTNPVNRLRLWTSAASNDVFNGVTYWTDDQLLAELDRVAKRQRVLLSCNDPIDRQIFLPAYNIYRYMLEEDFKIYKVSDDTEITTAYTYNSELSEITFVSSIPEGTEIYVMGLVLDLYMSARNVWFLKASHREEFVTFRTGTVRSELERVYDHCIERGNYFANKCIMGTRRNIDRGLYP